ncbi:hypothetical protein SUVZ_16G1930 [Saccharomyces uvarum]|uniref:AB hydrolase-1 domain-containing protein n=1 Tax=Saccharomyces uvarum TaxID=230603 RepID=A0ABN8WTE2_SACUV|nr:hypothetical protein SUVZ_16G1930 [Saccharomyces uvarum]
MFRSGYYPTVTPSNWGYNGTVKHVLGEKGTKALAFKGAKRQVPLDEFVTKYVPTLRDGANFRLNSLLFSGYLQSLYLLCGDLSKKFLVFYGREILEFPDGGVCTADWVMPEWKEKYSLDAKRATINDKLFTRDEQATHPKDWPRLHPRTRYLNSEEIEECHSKGDACPLVVVLHGLAGGSHEPFIKAISEDLSRVGDGKFQVVVLNSRGCARSKVTTRSLFTALHTNDVRVFVNRQRAQFPHRKIYAVGTSFGAALLTNYLGQEGDNCPLNAAAALSNPWDFVHTWDKLAHDWWSNHIFSRTLTQFLTRTVKVNIKELQLPEKIEASHKPTLEKPVFFTYTQENLEKAEKFTDMLEFDSLFTAPSMGLPDGLTYYRKASSVNRLPNIKIPTLIVNATDDPVTGENVIPYKQAKENPCVLLCETDLGGHLAYLDNENNSWLSIQTAEFFNKFDELIL